MSKSPVIKELLIEDIEATAGTQVRKSIDKGTVEDYAEAIQSRAVFPPLVVFAQKNSERYILADGFHRLAAAVKAGLTLFACEVHEGDAHDALAYALSANDQHGLRRSNKDKRNAVELALKDPHWCEWANTDIARLCRVGEKLVRTVREELVLSGEIDEPKTVKTTRKGKVVTRKSGKGAHSAKPNEADSGKKSGTSKKQHGPKSQDEVNKAEVQGALEAIKAMPYSGAEAVRRWGAEDLRSDFEYCADWLNEALAECEKRLSDAA